MWHVKEIYSNLSTIRVEARDESAGLSNSVCARTGNMYRAPLGEGSIRRSRIFARRLDVIQEEGLHGVIYVARDEDVEST